MDHREQYKISFREIMKELGDYLYNVILYGSVQKNTYGPDSDIDMALILDDDCRNFLVDGNADYPAFPSFVVDKVNRLSNMLYEASGIKHQLPVYWKSEYDEGIILEGTRPGSENLTKTGEALCTIDNLI